MDIIVLNDLETRIKKAELRYLETKKNYGVTSSRILVIAEEAIYLREWWILFVQGHPQVWFTPWDFFIKTKEYLVWKELKSESIFSKVQNWYGIK